MWVSSQSIVKIVWTSFLCEQWVVVNLNSYHINFAGWDLWCVVDKLHKHTDGNTVACLKEAVCNHNYVKPCPPIPIASQFF